MRSMISTGLVLFGTLGLVAYATGCASTKVAQNGKDKTTVTKADTPKSHSATRSRTGRRSKRKDKSLKVGDKAPMFTLNTFDDKTKSVSLASLVDEKPCVLFFGSYT